MSSGSFHVARFFFHLTFFFKTYVKYVAIDQQNVVNESSESAEVNPCKIDSFDAMCLFHSLQEQCECFARK